MNKTEPKVYVNVCVDCNDWLTDCGDAEALGELAAERAFTCAEGGAHIPRTSDVVIGVTLTDDVTQRALNRDYRGKDTPTNVLAFSQLGTVPLPAGARLLLGDVVLAFETVAREAVEQHKPLAHHLVHLVVHGVLHLLGFDHENDTEAAIMEAREVAILAALGVPDPYRDTI